MDIANLAKQSGASTEDKCIAYLEKMRWPDGVRCPTCGGASISCFQAKGRGGKLRHLYQCLDKTCRHQFSPTTGTIFHDSHLPLNKWFSAIALMADDQKPMSVNQLRLALGVQYKTAAHVVSRIRLAMENGTIELQGLASEKQVPAAQPADRSRGLTPAPLAARSAQARSAPHREVLAAQRAETAELLNRVTSQGGSQEISGTAVDNMLSMFVSFAQMSVRPPLFFVNYLKDKVFT
jgi:transposase-like zinc ribbon protein